MPTIPLPIVGPDYQGRINEQNTQSTINWFVENDAAGGRYPSILLPTEGLTSWTDLTGNVVRQLFVQDGLLYAVVDSTLYSITTDKVATSRGTLSTSTGRCQIAGISDQLMINDGSNGYTYTISSTTFATISDADFNSGAESVASLDSRFYYPKENTHEVYYSALSSGASWGALDFVSAESNPDDLVNVSRLRGDLWFKGTQSTEVWYSSGESTPIARRDVTIEKGCIAAHTDIELDNKGIWLGQTKDGQGQVYLADGFNIQVISTPVLEHVFSEFSTLSDAFAFGYQRDGHKFYWLTFPTASRSFVYDLTTGFWHERKSKDRNSVDTYNRHWANCFAFFNGFYLVGDYQSGVIYALDKDKYTDDGETIRRVRICQHVSKDNQMMRINNIRIHTKTGVGLVSGQGVDPKMMLRLSRDGCNTWGNEMQRSCGALGEYGTIPQWNRLGRAKELTIETAVTDPVEWCLLGGTADIELLDGI